MDPATIISQILVSMGLGAGQVSQDLDFSPGALFRAVLILVISFLVARIVRKLSYQALTRTDIDVRLREVIPQFAYYGILTLGILWALGGFGLSVLVLSVAVGFALKDLIQNFAAGMLVMGTRPFHKGDWINVNGSEGIVYEVGWRGTMIDAFDGRRIIVPNSAIISSKVTNSSVRPQLRCILNVSLDAKSDFAAVERTILEAVKRVDGISDKPAPVVFLESLSTQAMNLSVWIWVTDPVQSLKGVQSAAIRSIKEAFERNRAAVDTSASAILSISKQA